jgi:hypothetical protein
LEFPNDGVETNTTIDKPFVPTSMQLSEAQSSELPIQFVQSKREREIEKCQPVREEYRKAMSYFASI